MAIQLSGSLAITGSLVATSQIVAQTLNVQQVTSSIVYSSGSNIFGNSVSNTQQFTGSLQVSSSTSYILGNVGIGTTVLCSNGLSIRSTSDDYSLAILQQNTNTAGYGFFAGNSGDFSIARLSGGAYTSAALKIQLNTNVVCFSSTVCAPMVLASGCIGIGTTSPTTALEVSSTDLNNIFVTNPTTTGTTTGSGIGFKAYNGTSVAQAAGIILTSNTWNYGTYSANQLSIGSDGTGGIALRTANSAPISFFTGCTTAGLSAERMRLNSSGNLGLGVTPSAWVDYKVLQFGGGSISSYTDNLFIEVNQNAFWNGSSYVYVNNGFASRYQQNVGRHEWYQAPTGTASNAISFTQAMTLDASGRLGIGTTSPSYKLEVVGGAVNQQIARFITADYPAHSIGLGVEAAGGNWGVSIFQDDIRRFTIEENGGILVGSSYQSSDAPANGAAIQGNVGIGTTSPDSLLHVLNCSNSPYNDANTLASGQWFRTSNPSTCTGATSGIMFVAQGPGGGNGLATINGVTTSCGSMAITFGTRNTSGNVTERMRIGSCGLTKFSLTPSSLSKTNMSCFSSGYVYLGNLQGVTNEEVGLFGGNDPSSLSAGMGIYRESSSNWAIGLRFYTHVSSTGVGVSDLNRALDISGDGIACFQNTVCMPVLLASGCIGIGTTSPSQKLSLGSPKGIEGTATAYGSNDQGSIMWSYEYTGIFPRHLDIIAAGSPDGTNGGGNIRFFTNPVTNAANSVERMRITSGGGVVIGGTVASNVGLTIYGSNAATIYQTPNTGTGATNGFYVGHTGDVSYVWNYNNYPTVFATNNTERMRITSGGNVGIGATSPASLLDIYGSLYGSLVTSRFLDNANYNDSPGGGIGFGGKYTSGGEVTEYGIIRGIKENTTDGNYSGFLQFQTRPNNGTWAERMRITSAGITCFACTVCTPRIVAGEAILGNSYTCTFPVACVGGNYATVIPPNTLNSLTVYLAHIYYDNGTASPYTANTAFIFKTTNTNGGGTDNAYFPMTSTHQGGTGCWSFRTIAGTGQVSSGLQIQAHSFANNISNATLYLVRLA